jgi:hypothetical protein
VSLALSLELCDGIEFFLHRMQLCLPSTVTPDGPRLFLHRAGIYDTDVYSVNDTMHVGMMINDMRMMTDDNLIVAGAVSKNEKM